MAVWLLPGQGAQEPGMGSDIAALPEVAETFQVASRQLGIDVARLACEAPAEEVNEAFNAQAVTMAVSVGLGRALFAQGICPDAVVGFSLGQISALALTGTLSLDDAFALLKVRSQAMAAACSAHPGGMVALLGASVADAEALAAAQAQGQVLVAANHNAPGQVVVSGEEAALERAQSAWQAEGKRCVRLNTAGAFHSPLMDDAAEAVAHTCKNLTFSEPCVPLLCNTDAHAFTAAQASERLAAQVKSPVMFQESIESLLAAGYREYVEVGHGKVLSNLIKRIDRKTSRTQAGNAQQLNAYVEQVAAEQENKEA